MNNKRNNFFIKAEYRFTGLLRYARNDGSPGRLASPPAFTHSQACSPLLFAPCYLLISKPPIHDRLPEKLPAIVTLFHKIIRVNPRFASSLARRGPLPVCLWG
jgi:hypothetical protein